MIKNRILFNSAVRNDIDGLKKGISQQGLDVNMRCEETGATALKIAVSIGHMECVRFLLEQGAKPDIADNKGNTPLHDIVLQAVGEFLQKDEQKCLQIAQLLLERGANPDIKNKRGSTPFSYVEKGVTDKARHMRDLLLPHRKNTGSALPEIAAGRNETVFSQPKLNTNPPPAPVRKSWPAGEKEANPDENARENAALLLSKGGMFSEKTSRLPDTKESLIIDKMDCILM